MFYSCAKTFKGSCLQIYGNFTSRSIVPSNQVLFMFFAACFLLKGRWYWKGLIDMKDKTVILD